VGDAVLVVGTRIGLWLGVQLLVAGLLVLVGAAAAGQALNEAAGWWMVYGALVDLGTLGVIGWLLRREGGSYRRLLGPPTTAWQVALGAVEQRFPPVERPTVNNPAARARKARQRNAEPRESSWSPTATAAQPGRSRAGGRVRPHRQRGIPSRGGHHAG
jgi:hypothetical protein